MAAGLAKQPPKTAETKNWSGIKALRARLNKESVDKIGDMEVDEKLVRLELFPQKVKAYIKSLISILQNMQGDIKDKALIDMYAWINHLDSMPPDRIITGEEMNRLFAHINAIINALVAEKEMPENNDWLETEERRYK